MIALPAASGLLMDQFGGNVELSHGVGNSDVSTGKTMVYALAWNRRLSLFDTLPL